LSRLASYCQLRQGNLKKGEAHMNQSGDSEIQDILSKLKPWSEDDKRLIVEWIWKNLIRYMITVATSVLKAKGFQRLADIEQAAFDVVQKVFVNIWVYLDSYDHQKAELKTWIRKIVVNEATKKLKEQGIDVEREDKYVRSRFPEIIVQMDDDGDKTLDIVDDSLDPEEMAIVNEEEAISRKIIEKCLRELNPRERDILLMRHNEEMEFKEIAAVVGIAPVNARVIYLRARGRMRLCLEQHGITSSKFQ
jgi:RNA polymerase sigma factor (sigma-70 family)